MPTRQETLALAPAVKIFNKAYKPVISDTLCDGTPRSRFEIRQPGDNTETAEIEIYEPPNYLRLHVKNWVFGRYSDPPHKKVFEMEFGFVLDDKGHVTGVKSKYVDPDLSVEIVANVWCVLGGQLYMVDYIRDLQDPLVAQSVRVRKQRIDTSGLLVTEDLPNNEEIDIVKEELAKRGIPPKFDVPGTAFRILTEFLTPQQILDQPFVPSFALPQTQNLPAAV